MSGFWLEYGLFVAKIFTVVVAIVIVVLVAASGSRRRPEESHLEIKDLNKRFDALRRVIADEVFHRAEEIRAEAPTLPSDPRPLYRGWSWSRTYRRPSS